MISTDNVNSLMSTDDVKSRSQQIIHNFNESHSEQWSLFVRRHIDLCIFANCPQHFLWTIGWNWFSSYLLSVQEQICKRSGKTDVPLYWWIVRDQFFGQLSKTDFSLYWRFHPWLSLCFFVARSSSSMFASYPGPAFWNKCINWCSFYLLIVRE